MAKSEADDLALAKTSLMLKAQRELLSAWRAPWPNLSAIPDSVGAIRADVYSRCASRIMGDIGLGAQDAPKRTEALSPSGQTPGQCYRGNELNNTPIDDCGIPIRDDRAASRVA